MDTMTLQSTLPVVKPVSSAMIQALCAETGWPANAHADNGLTIPLEVPEAYFQAVVHPEEDDQLVLHVELCRLEAVSNVVRQAIDALLSMIARRVRMARSRTKESDEGISFHLEITVPASVRPGEWSDALSALSVACDLCWREVEALREEEIARVYLRNQGCVV